MIRTSTAILAMIASTATAQEATHAVDLDSLSYAASPLSPLIETASVYGDRAAEGLYTTHARVGDGAVVPPHTHTNTLTTVVTSGTAFVGTGTTFDEDALVAYPEGAFFVTPAGSPHFIMARDGAFSILDHGAGPSSTTFLD